MWQQFGWPTGRQSLYFQILFWGGATLWPVLSLMVDGIAVCLINNFCWFLATGVAVSSTVSASLLGARFALSGLTWRPRQKGFCFSDFCFALSLSLVVASSPRVVDALVDSWPATTLAISPVSH